MSQIPPSALDPVEKVLGEFAAGRPVVVLADASDAGEGVLVFAAEHATSSSVAFAVRYGSGFLRVALLEDDADRLQLPLMVHAGDTGSGRGPWSRRDTVAVDAREGVTTGISATDRARTIALLADPHAGPGDFNRPGHVVPVRVDADGVLGRPAHAEAGLDLARLSGCLPAAVFVPIVSDLHPAGMAATAELRTFADAHGLAVTSVDAIVAHRQRSERLVARAAQARIPLRQGTFTAIGYSSVQDAREHIAFVLGDLADAADVLVRVHFECVIGDVFGALDCACRQTFDTALDRIGSAGCGVLLYIRRAERGHGDFLRASGMSADPRDRRVVEEILDDLGIRSARFISGHKTLLARVPDERNPRTA